MKSVNRPMVYFSPCPQSIFHFFHQPSQGWAEKNLQRKKLVKSLLLDDSYQTPALIMILWVVIKNLTFPSSGYIQASSLSLSSPHQSCYVIFLPTFSIQAAAFPLLSLVVNHKPMRVIYQQKGRSLLLSVSSSMTGSLCISSVVLSVISHLHWLSRSRNNYSFPYHGQGVDPKI